MNMLIHTVSFICYQSATCIKLPSTRKQAVSVQGQTAKMPVSAGSIQYKRFPFFSQTPT